MKHLAPIVLFVYNRPWHTQQTVEALQSNKHAKESNLIIYSDAPKNNQDCSEVRAVRNCIKSITGFKSIKVIERKKNWGLANSIIDGVTKVVNEYGKIIVLEDDLVTSPYFLKFMNEALEFYEEEEKVFTVSGYSNIKIPKSYADEVYFAHISTSWGWATWEREWNTVDWNIASYAKILNNKNLYSDLLNKVGNSRLNMLKKQIRGNIDSWAVRRLFSQLLQNKMTVFPIKTFIRNIGHDGTGVHCGENIQLSKVEVSNTPISNFSRFYNCKSINKIIFKKNHKYRKSILRKVLNKLKKMISK